MYGEDQRLAPAGEQVQGRFENVAEAWPMYDTLIVASEKFGSEVNAQGWFASLVAMGQQETHSFFKQRTEAIVGLAYSNKQVQDQMDFPYEAFSWGCSFFAPGCRGLRPGDQQAREGSLDVIFSQIAHWWETELPRHCCLQLKVQQDIVAELPSMACSPGYGPCVGGASYEHENVYRVTTEGSENPDYHDMMNMGVTQGVPNLSNRWSLTAIDKMGVVQPLKIARTNNIEVILTVSREARTVLQNMISVIPSYLWGGVDTVTPPAAYPTYPARFGIQVSLMGKRLVQQRAQYHR